MRYKMPAPANSGHHHRRRRPRSPPDPILQAVKELSAASSSPCYDSALSASLVTAATDAQFTPTSSYVSANSSWATADPTAPTTSSVGAAAGANRDSGSSINQAHLSTTYSYSDSDGAPAPDVLKKPHQADDARWAAVQAVRDRDGALGPGHFTPLRKLGYGDIGTVYLVGLRGTGTSFAMKVMDKLALAGRKKLMRALIERDILQRLDHPFLPTLYTHFETDSYSCLVMDFCPGGDLHSLRQQQPRKCFSERAARFYVAEVLLALEYLHMVGVIYRDLKPENVLVREDGHIMLSDFDLSLRCNVSPTLVRASNLGARYSKNSGNCIRPSCIEPTCMQPSCMQPACFAPGLLSKKDRDSSPSKQRTEVCNQVMPFPELVAEPTNARSMSFVGTHEYLAPEIIKGQGHGSAVDWWTLGIFLYELLFGKTPFKGPTNRATMFNVVGEPLKFPDSPTVSFAARDLIRRLLVKEPQKRLATRRGATEVKQHPFFLSMNWALIRCTSPPEVSRPLKNNRSEGGDGVPAAPAVGNVVVSGGDLKAYDKFLDVDLF